MASGLPPSSSSLSSSSSAAAPAVPSSSLLAAKEKTNHTRLSRLLIGVGRCALKDVFDAIHPPSTLNAVLCSGPVYSKLTSLKSRRILNTQQWKKLFPGPGSSASSANFDVTLLFLLLRNICSLAPPATDWDRPPSPLDLSMQADLARIKLCRNELYAHTLDLTLSDTAFETNWNDIKGALIRLGGQKYEAEIEQLKVDSIDAECENTFNILLQAWEEGETKILDAIRKLGTGTNSEEIKVKGLVKIATIGGVVLPWAAGSAYILHRYSEDPEMMLELVEKAIIPYGVLTLAGAIVVAIVQGSFVIKINVSSLEALDQLWESYKTGEMKRRLETVIVTDNLKALAPDDVETITISISISEDDYEKARDSLITADLKSSMIRNMATSRASETDEKVNYTKLCRILYDGGTLAVRTVFDGRCPPASLSTLLTTNRSKLQKLKKPTGKVLSQDQWDKLYPPSGAIPKSENFDITLLFVLLRNICGLKKPATGWDALPLSADTSLEANLVRIKYYRNNVIAHSSKAEVDDTAFKAHWSVISGALGSLGLKQYDIDELESSPLGTKNYNQLVNEWNLSDQEIKCQLEDIKSAIHLSIAETRDRFSGMNKLAHRDFSRRIDKLYGLYHPDTRKWLMTDVKSSVDQANVVVIEAGPGMGKSVVAAKLCQEYRHQGNLGGCLFFRHDNSLQNNPRLMLQSVARQLCDNYPDYRDVLETSLSKNLGKDLSELSCAELFTLLFEEPCAKLKSERHFVVIIDALDECCNSLKKELFSVLSDITSVLPLWLRFVLTTRPPPSMSSFHSVGQTIRIDPKDPRNESDILTYFTDKLKGQVHIRSDLNENQITQLVDVTEGFFLVAFFVIDFLRKTNVNSMSEAVEQFPKGKGITSVYEDYFSRLKKAITPHIRCEEGFFEMLDAIVAAKFPIEKSMIYSILGLKDEPRVPNRERKEAINLLHQLFPVENDHVSAFHKSVIDWLTTGDHDYRVKGDGCGILANKCYDVINGIKQNIHLQDQSPDFTDRDKYALTFGSEYYNDKCFSKEKKIEMQTDPLVLYLTASTIVNDYYNRDQRRMGNWYDNLFEEQPTSRAIYKYLKKRLTREKTPSTSWHKHPTVLQLLEFAYRAVNLLNIGDTAKILDHLKEKGIAYHERQTLLELRDEEKFQQILVCNNGLLLVQHKKKETVIRKYQLNGNLVKEISFDGYNKLYMSPDERFIVAILAIVDERDIDIIDAATLQIIKGYKSPNVVRSCHVFGSKPWYLVVRCFNNKIYVMDGETGKLVGHPTAVQQNDDVLSVSKVGHILIARTSGLSPYQFSDSRFTDEDEYFCESMVWQIGDVLSSRQQSGLAFRELFLSGYQKHDEQMPIYARPPAWCSCQRHDEGTDSLSFNEQPLCFSEDGSLLAFCYRQCITVVHTSDGSLYKSVCLSFDAVSPKEILFLSKEMIYMIVQEEMTNHIISFKFGEKEYDVVLGDIFFLPEKVDISRVLTRENNLMALFVVHYTQGIKRVNNVAQMVKSTHAIKKYNFF